MAQAQHVEVCEHVATYLKSDNWVRSATINVVRGNVPIHKMESTPFTYVYVFPGRILDWAAYTREHFARDLEVMVHIVNYIDANTPAKANKEHDDGQLLAQQIQTGLANVRMGDYPFRRFSTTGGERDAFMVDDTQQKHMLHIPMGFIYGPAILE